MVALKREVVLDLELWRAEWEESERGAGWFSSAKE